MFWTLFMMYVGGAGNISMTSIQFKTEQGCNEAKTSIDAVLGWHFTSICTENK